MAKTFYITTPIYYVNSSPHIGTAYTDILCDVFARYRRRVGDEVFFLTGTDEHGAKVSRAAELSGIPIAQFVDKNAAKFDEMAKVLGISNDYFIRTSDQKRHYPGAIKLWKKLEQAGDFYKAMYKGLYCVGHEAFVTEKDLDDKGRCAEHEQSPEVIKEENYFFRLSKYKDRVREVIESGRMNIFPETRRNEALAMLDGDIEDVSFSRPTKDIPWGIPVPGDPTQTMYVWCDALANYVSALGYGGEDESNFDKFWPADVHVTGKDILRFHAILWPAMLMSAGLELPKKLIFHGYIVSGGKKMSKTLGNVVDPFEVVKKYGRDALRYYLLSEMKTGEDYDFTMQRFGDIYNAHLANRLGNLVSRTSAMIQRFFSGSVDKPAEAQLIQVPTRRHIKKEVSDATMFLEAETLESYFNREVRRRYDKYMEALDTHAAINIVFDFLAVLDGYVQDYEPYKLFKKNPDMAQAVLWNLGAHIAVCAELLAPFIPDSAEKIKNLVSIEKTSSRVNVTLSSPLFPRI